MKKIEIWLDDTTVDTIDQRRGLAGRSTWLRDLIERALTPAGEPRPISSTPYIPIDENTHIAKQTPAHRHRYDKTDHTRPKPNGRGIEHEHVCGGCGDIKWEA